MVKRNRFWETLFFVFLPRVMLFLAVVLMLLILSVGCHHTIGMGKVP